MPEPPGASAFLARMTPPAVAADAELVTRLRSLLLTRGGFTLDARSGHPVPEGYAVAVEPARSLSFRFAAWDDRVVGRWVHAARTHVAERAGPRLHLGGWYPPGLDRVTLDIVHVLPPARPQLALWTARRHHQWAVFDLARGALVPLGAR
jgi:hypothetical protein